MLRLEAEQLVDLLIGERVHRLALAQVGDHREARPGFDSFLRDRVDTGATRVRHGQSELFGRTTLGLSEPNLLTIRPCHYVTPVQLLRRPPDRLTRDAIETRGRTLDEVRQRPVDERLECQVRGKEPPLDRKSVV